MTGEDREAMTTDTYSADTITAGTVPALIRLQAARHPDRIAVVHGDRTLTFAQLMHQAEGLARVLRAADVRREDVVGCAVPRSLATVTAVLGVWMAAGTYLPIDPAAPARRTEHMLKETGAAVVVTTGEGLIPGSPQHVIRMDARGAVVGAAAAPVLGAEPVEPGDGDLAYIIYTSGSTGRPKGVLVEHGSLADMAAAHEEVLHPQGAPTVQRVALNAVTTADTFFSDLVNLAAGRTLVVIDESSRRDPERLARFLADYRIDVLDATPTQLRALLLSEGAGALAALRVLVIGNEPADTDLWRTLRGLTGVRVHNFYGPTECTVDVTSAALADSDTPVIGRPLTGGDIWLVDPALNPVPDGEAGEICVTGRCLARGYLNASEADDARFVLLRTGPGSRTVRAYRTGDRARRNQTGLLEFLGRIDDQANISGHRVEPREVEAALRSCPTVLDAAVAVRDRDGAASLAAWAVLAPGGGVEQVVGVLRTMLPPYMIPTVTEVPRIPMNASGKADTAALLATSGGSAAHGTAAAETTSAEAPSREIVPGGTADAAADPLDRLRSIWCDVLGVTDTGAAHDFFAAGGDSLKATRLIVAVRKAFAPDLPIRTIFDHPHFGAFAGAVTGKAPH